MLKKITHTKNRIFILLICVFFCFSSCKTQNSMHSESFTSMDTIHTTSETIQLSLVSFDADQDLNKMANQFHDKHNDVVISIDYREREDDLEVMDSSGINKMKRDISIGKGPDIIDFGTGYTTTDIQGNYTIDLSEYIKYSDIPLIDSFIEAYSLNGEILALPTEAMVLSLIVEKQGNETVTSWNIDQIIQYYQEYCQKYPGAYFSYGDGRMGVLDTLTMFSMDNFIDWEEHTCDFECDEFKKIVLFCKEFPEEFPFDVFESMDQFYQNSMGAFKCGGMSDMFGIYDDRFSFGNKEIQYIGYPVKEGSGYMLSAFGHVFAISKNCKYPDQAWAFIESFYEKEYQREVTFCPMNRDVFEELMIEARTESYSEGVTKPSAKYTYTMQDENVIEIPALTESDEITIRNIIERANQPACYDYCLLNIIDEECNRYFNGESTIDEICSIIQSRVTIYVKEKE